MALALAVIAAVLRSVSAVAPLATAEPAGAQRSPRLLSALLGDAAEQWGQAKDGQEQDLHLFFLVS